MNKSRPDLLLINPGNARQVYQSLADDLAAIENPVWAGLMATFAEKQGLKVEILDANAYRMGPDDVAKRVQEIDPVLSALVVYGQQPSASTQNMPAASAITTAIKHQNPEQKILLIGGHVASLPDKTLEEESADFVALGEGLYTLTELASALKSGRSEDLVKVRGLGWREGNKVRYTAPAPLIRDLDGLMPGVAWDHLPMDRYRAHNWHCFDGLNRQPYASLYTSLGCPYHCAFCCIQAPFKDSEKAAGLKEDVNSYRLWSPEVVLSQLDILVNKYGVKNIKFADELFVINPNHVEKICDGIIERGYDLNIWAYARVDTVRMGMIPKLKKAGFNWLAFGIEAASAKVRDNIQKGYGQEDIVKTIEAVRDEGIYVIGNYIFGLPEDDLSTMQETLDLSLELNCEFANFYCTMAYPGSALYTKALQEKWPLPEKWSGYSQHSVDMLPLPTNHLPSSDVIRFRDKAFHIYFSDPNYLAMVEKKFGLETVAHIKEMASHRLERANA